MADLTYGAEVVHDGNDAAITGGIKTYTDPNDSNRKGAVVAVVTADGTVLRLGQALAAASLPVVLTAAQLASLSAPVLGAGVAHIGEVSLDAAALAALETITVASVTAPLAAGTNNIGDVDIATIAAGETHIGEVGGRVANPTSTLTRPADTSAYAQNDLIASSTTAGSVAVPSFTATRIAAGSCMIRRVRLSTNKTSGWGGASLKVRLWSAAPTYSNGDNGAYAVATGAANYLGAFTVTLEQWADGAVGIGSPGEGGDVGVKLASGQAVYWDIQTVGSTGLTPASGQTFTIIPECYQD